jgi:hypothetical protein
MKKKILLPILALLFLVASCGKYEEGPSFSLRTKKARVTGTWNIEKIIVNGEEQPTTFNEGGFQFSLDDIDIELNKDNSATITIPVPFIGSVTDDGEWDFSNNKENIKISGFTQMEAINGEGKILRLTNSELWVLTEDDDDVTETHYKKQ